MSKFKKSSIEFYIHLVERRYMTNIILRKLYTTTVFSLVGLIIGYKYIFDTDINKIFFFLLLFPFFYLIKEFYSSIIKKGNLHPKTLKLGVKYVFEYIDWKSPKQKYELILDIIFSAICLVVIILNIQYLNDNTFFTILLILLIIRFVGKTLIYTGLSLFLIIISPIRNQSDSFNKAIDISDEINETLNSDKITTVGKVIRNIIWIIFKIPDFYNTFLLISFIIFFITQYEIIIEDIEVAGFLVAIIVALPIATLRAMRRWILVLNYRYFLIKLYEVRAEFFKKPPKRNLNKAYKKLQRCIVNTDSDLLSD